MSENTTLEALPTNLLLANLPSAEYQRLLPKLEQFTLNYGETIYNQGEIIDYVYFPTSGIISLLVTVEANSPDHNGRFRLREERRPADCGYRSGRR